MFQRKFLFVVAAMGFCATSTVAQPCAYLPPGGPIAFGLLQIAQLQVTDDTGESPLWLADGRVVIGSPLSSPNGQYRHGTIWVFNPYPENLHGELQTIIPPPITGLKPGFGSFGRVLATSGPWLAASARLTNDSFTVCLMEATGPTEWTFRTNFFGDVSASGDSFGSSHRSIAMDDGWMAVIRYETSGRVHLYRVTDEGVWEERQQLVVPGFQTAAMHSTTLVDIRDETLVVGVSQNGSSSFTGQAHVWRRDQSDVWNYETNLAATNLAAGDRYGRSVAIGENKIFVSSTGFDLTKTDGGAMFLFERQGGLWSETARFAPTNLTGSQFIGSHIAYSDLRGEYLAEGSGGIVRMYQPTGPGGSWKMVSQGHSGRIFRNWESPAGTVKDYIYSPTNASVDSLSVRAHQVLVGHSSMASLLEHGWHSIITRHISIDPPCSVRPIGYAAIGAPRDDGHDRIGDVDADGISDFAEIYFGTTTDSSNVLSAGLTAIVTNQSVKIQWPRSNDTNLLVTAEPQWSTNLIDWSTNGLSVVKVADEPDTTREIVEVTLPDTGESGYLRLLISTPPPPE